MKRSFSFKVWIYRIMGMIAIIGLAAIGLSKEVPVLPRASAAELQIAVPDPGSMPDFPSAATWLNSPPLTSKSLRGKVVLVEFWTYTCINWRRQLPYVRAWSQRYKDQGLVVIGVHAPEFSFEKDLDNVRQAIKYTHVDFPVVIDNKQEIWRSFNNEAWPALYFIDAKGRIRHVVLGEGEYQRSELILQQLLHEAGAPEPDRRVVVPNAQGADAEADWPDLMSSENYLGYERTENFSSPGGAKHNKSNTYTAPAQLKLNHWALSGDWTSSAEKVSLNNANGRIAYQFHARDLNLVMGPRAAGTPIHFRVLIDGAPPGPAHGVDVDEQGNGTLTEPRMYQLIRQQMPITDRRFEIEFLSPGAEAYSFTFG